MYEKRNLMRCHRMYCETSLVVVAVAVVVVVVVVVAAVMW